MYGFVKLNRIDRERRVRVGVRCAWEYGGLLNNAASQGDMLIFVLLNRLVEFCLDPKHKSRFAIWAAQKAVNHMHRIVVRTSKKEFNSVIVMGVWQR